MNENLKEYYPIIRDIAIFSLLMAAMILAISYFQNGECIAAKEKAVNDYDNALIFLNTTCLTYICKDNMCFGTHSRTPADCEAVKLHCASEAILNCTWSGGENTCTCRI